MVMTPRIGDDFVQWRPPTGDDSTLGIVDFSICPHLAQGGMPGNSMAEAEQWAAGISGPAYAMDDETAIKVVDGTVEVASEGHWKHFASQLPTPTASERNALSCRRGARALSGPAERAACCR